jgi:hypothetical protein
LSVRLVAERCSSLHRCPKGRQYGVDDALRELAVEWGAAEQQPVVDGPEQQLVGELYVGIRPQVAALSR